jgi:hypothetical protein
MGVHFYVKDANSGVWVQGALCMVTAGVDGSGDGDSGLTDASGHVYVDGYFTANWWQVFKDGYVTQTGTYPGIIVNVSLVAGPTMYALALGVIGQGSGSITATVNGTAINPMVITYIPSGSTVKVTALAQSGSSLLKWLVQDADQNPANPLTISMPKQTLSIYADFELIPSTTYKGIPIYHSTATGTYYFVYNGQTYNEPSVAQCESLIDALLSTGYPWQKTLVLASSRDLESNQAQTGASFNSPKFHLGEATKFMGAKVSYRIRYVDGLGGCSVGVDVNTNNMAKWENIAVGSDISGSFDATSLLAATHNYITCGQSHLPGFWDHCTYDVSITLGYTSAPAVEPGIEAEVPELPWWAWVIVAGGVVVGVYAMSKRRGGK